MRLRPPVPARRCATGLALLGVAAAVAGCGTTGTGGTSGTSGVSATGSTLSIWISVPPHATPAEQDVVDAEKLAFAAQSKSVTRVALRLRVAAGAKLSDNARLAIQDKSAIAYLGEIAPGSSEQTVGITNALDLLQVSPTDTAVELTQSTPAIKGAPDRYYESTSSYGRTFVRLVPTTAQEAAAQVSEMRHLGVKSLFVGDDGTGYGRALAAAVRHDAAGSSISVASNLSGADAAFYADSTAAEAARSFSAATAQNAKLKLFAPSAVALTGGASALGQARNVFISVPAPAAGSSQASFTKAFTTAYNRRPDPQAVFGFEAMSAVLTALKDAGKSVADRSTVIKDLRSIRGRSSVLGTYSIDHSGDTSLTTFRFLRPSGGALVAVPRGTISG